MGRDDWMVGMLMMGKIRVGGARRGVARFGAAPLAAVLLTTVLSATALVSVTAPAALAADAPSTEVKRIESMAMSLREMTIVDDVRVANMAREMAALGEAGADTLLDLLTDPVAAVRQAATLALSELSLDHALPDLIARLGDESPGVAIAAVQAVSKYEGDWPTTALVRWLAHEDGNVREAVLIALGERDAKELRATIRTQYETPPVEVGSGPFLAAMGRFPDRGTKKLLMAGLDTEHMAIDALRGLSFFGPGAARDVARWVNKNSSSRPAIAAGGVAVLVGYGKKGDKALGGILARLPESLKAMAVDAMVRELGDEAGSKLTALSKHRDGRLRALALARMPSVKGSDPAKHAEKNLRHKHQDVRMLCGEALKHIGRHRGMERLVITRYRELARKRGDGNASERVKLLEALGRVGDAEAVAELVQAMGHDDEMRPALDALGDIGSKAVGTLLFVIKTGDPVRTRVAVSALAKAGPDAVRPLMGLLVHTSRDVRNTARRALAEIGAVEVVPQVVELIKDTRSPGRIELVHLLGALYSDAAFKALREFGRRDGEWQIRLAAVEMLGTADDKKTLSVLTEAAVKDQNHEVRHRAVQGLIWQGDTGSVDLLIKMLGYEKDFIRKTAAFGVGYLAGPDKVDDLIPKMSTPRDEIIRAVRQSLQRITWREDISEADQFGEYTDEWLDKDHSVPPVRHGEMTLADGTVLHYWLGGSGRPLLMIPDGPDYPHDYFRPAADVLMDGHLVVFVDLPGRGRSTGPTAEGVAVGLDHDVRSLATMLARLNLRDIDVYGHGFGAMTAVELTHRYPKLVHRVVLDNTPVPTRLGWTTRFDVALAKVPSPWLEDLQVFQDDAKKFNPAVRDRALTIALLTGATANRRALIGLWPRLKTDGDLRGRILGPMGEFDRRESYAKIEKPTLLIDGPESPMSDNGKSWRDRLVRKNPHVTLETIERTGHVPFYENTRDWVDAIDGFLL